jgi:hypothetical protein
MPVNFSTLDYAVYDILYGILQIGHQTLHAITVSTFKYRPSQIKNWLNQLLGYISLVRLGRQSKPKNSYG